MSSHLHYEIARARQQEAATRTIHTHHAGEMHGTGGPRRPVSQRFGRAAAALSACLAVAIAVTVGSAHANPSSAKSSGRVSAQHYAGEIRALEARDYVPTSCTIGGTLMHNYRTGRSVTVKL